MYTVTFKKRFSTGVLQGLAFDEVIEHCSHDTVLSYIEAVGQETIPCAGKSRYYISNVQYYPEQV